MDDNKLAGPSCSKQVNCESNPLMEQGWLEFLKEELYEDDGDFDFQIENKYVPNDVNSKSYDTKTIKIEDLLSSPVPRNLIWEENSDSMNFCSFSETDNDCDFETDNNYDSSGSYDPEISEVEDLEYQNLPSFENITWEDHTGSMNFFPFTRTEGLQEPVPGNDPIHYFRHILTDRFLDEIVLQTNRYAVELLLRPNTKEKSRITFWKDVSRDELLVFLGLLLHMGNVRLNRIEDYWKTDYLFDLRIFPNNMGRNRFLLLLHTLHFDANLRDAEQIREDDLYNFKNIINHFNSRMSEIFQPGRELCIDESMIVSRGRIILPHYMKNKHRKYGFKLYMLTTPTGIVIKCMASAGMLENCREKSHITEIVLNLLEGLYGVGHSLYIDSYYNSYELAKCLANNGTHCTGMLKENRKSFPKEIVKRKLKRDETMAKYSDGVLIGKWKSNRELTYISNEYTNDMLKVETGKEEIRLKPLPLIQYNKYMCTVDRLDKVFQYYPCERKCLKWHTKIFVHILQLMMINAHHLYNKYSGNKLTIYEFRLTVIKHLLKKVSLPGPRAVASDHVLKVRDVKKSGKVVRKHCKHCYSQGRRRDTIYVCSTCPGAPGYCLDCANITHK